MPTLPATMTAIAISQYGGPEVLVPEQRPVPQPGDSEILIRVAAAGVNPLLHFLQFGQHEGRSPFADGVWG